MNATMKKAEHTGGANRAGQPKYCRHGLELNADDTCYKCKWEDVKDINKQQAEAIEGLIKVLKKIHLGGSIHEKAIEAALKACGVKV